MSLPRNPVRRNVPPYRPPTSFSGNTASAPHPAPSPLPDQAPSLPRAGAGLILRIDGTLYELALAPYDPRSVALRVWRLAKLDGDRASYQVCELPRSEGWHACECGDWIYRREGKEDLHLEGCKHIRAVRDLVGRGLLAPLPLTLATDPDGDPTWEELDDAWSIGPTPESCDPSRPFLVGAAAERQEEWRRYRIPSELDEPEEGGSEREAGR